MHIDSLTWVDWGATKRAEATGVAWQIAMRPGKRRSLSATPWGTLAEQIEKAEASIRAKVEHPFRATKHRFGHVKVRYRGHPSSTVKHASL